MYVVAPFSGLTFHSWPKGFQCRFEFKVVSFVPPHGGYQSSHCLHVRADCALLFTYMTYSYSDNTTVNKIAHCGKLTAALLVVFLGRFCMQCMDVHSNPALALAQSTILEEE